jgi:anti-sigma B factor antagonist
MERTSLSLSVQALDQGRVVTVAGEVDMATAPRLAECLVQFESDHVVVDLTLVEFIDSSGLAALAAATCRIARRGGRLVVRGASPITLRALEITGLDQVLDLDRNTLNRGGSTE